MSGSSPEVKVMMNRTEKKNLLKGICLALILTLCLLCGSALAVNELDGSKIESVTLSWITEGSEKTNTGADYTSADPDHLFIATASDNELSLKYQVDISFSGQFDYEPGMIRITLPAQVWHQRVYEDGIGHATGALFGNLELSVPEAPSADASFNWQRESTADGDVYVLTNTRTIGATNKASLQFTVCDVLPHEIADMSICDPISVKCEVITNKGNMISLDSENQLTVQLDTVEKLPDNGTVKLSKYYSAIPAHMPVGYLNSLPGGPATASNYVVVEWEVYVNHEGNQPFTLTLEDDFSNVYRLDEHDQPVPVAVKPLFLGCEPGFYDGYPARLFSFDTGDPKTAKSFTYKTVIDPSYDDHRNDPLTGKDHLITVWTAYAKADMPAENNNDAILYYFENTAKCTLTEADAEVNDAVAGKDERAVTVSSATAKESYTAVNKFFSGTLTVVNKFTKDGVSYEEEYPYTLNRLQKGENADLEFLVEADHFTWDLTTADTWNTAENRPCTEEEMKNVQRDETNYGKLGWRFTVTDDKLYFNGSNQPMDGEDYYISSVQLDEITKVAYGPCSSSRTLAWAPADDGTYKLRWVYLGEDCYYEDPTLPMADLVFEIQLNGTWVPAATATWNGSDVSFTGMQNGVTGDAASATLHFPDGTTGYRYTATSTLVGGKYLNYSALAGVIVKLRPTVTVKPSDHVMEAVNSAAAVMTNPSVITKNTVSMTSSGWVDASGKGSDPVPVNDDYAIADMTSALYGAYLIKTGSYDPSADNNVAARTATVHYTGTLHETTNLKDMNEYRNAQAGGAIPAETSGRWYDLLPEGMIPDLNTVRVGGKDQITAVYTVPEYRGSGRTLLVVEADLTPALTTTKDDAKDIEDVHTLTFDGIISYDEIETFGEQQKNYMAFESRTDDLTGGILGTMLNLQGAPDRPDTTLNNHTPGDTDMPAEIRALMTGLNPDSDPDDARFVYAFAPVTTSVNFAAISGLAKTVSTKLNGVWTQGLNGQTQATVYEGHDYTYRLKVTSDSETITKDIFLFDTIENYHVPDDGTKTSDHEHIQERIGWKGDWSKTGQWRGTLKSIDLSEFVRAGAAPVLYYSVQPDLQFADSAAGATQAEKDLLFNSGEYDVTSACWKKAELDADGVWTVPDGTAVTAFAADLSHDAEGEDFLLGTGRSATVYLNMTAPDDNGDETVMHAKGAYARTDADGPIDWEAAADPANNMYAYNNTRMRCVQYDAKSTSASASNQTMIRNDYTRVGIIPQAIRVVKEWQDEDNHDGIRPESLTITLMRKKAGAGAAETVTDESGKPYTVTLNEANSWSGIFLQTDIVDENGEPWQYQFRESLADGTPLENGYTLQWNRTGTNTYTLTNTRENETVTVAGTKTWLNDEEVPYKRPERIVLQLYQDGSKVDEITVEPDSLGQWKYTFGTYEKYKKYDPKKGIAEEHEYTVTELPETGYFANTDDYTHITNEYDPYGNLAIAKIVTNEEISAETAKAEFTFRVSLYAERTVEEVRAAEPRTPLTGKYKYVIQQNVNGDWVSTGAGGTIGHGGTVTLKANQRALIEKLPAGATYEAEEENKAGYRQTKNEQTVGTIQSRVITAALFKNEYYATGTIVLKAKKELQGEALKNRQFRFELVDENNKVITSAYNGVPDNKQADDGTITGNADVIFPQLKFTEKDIGKTYTYTMRETANGSIVAGMTYANEITVMVKIADNGDGTLKVTAEKDGSVYTPHTFTNKYSVKCKAELELRKVLEGRVLKDQEFTFGLYACEKDGKNPSADPLMTVKCDADGNIVFKDGTVDGPLTFTEKDLTLDYELGTEGAEPEPHYFLVREIPGTDSTVSYTNEQKVFTVRVFDRRDGTLGYTVDTQKISVTEDKCINCDGTGEWLTPVMIDTYRYGRKRAEVSVIGITAEEAREIISSKTIYTKDFNYRTHAGDYGIQDYDYFLTETQFRKTLSSGKDDEPVICPTCLGYGAVGNIAHIKDVTVGSDGSITTPNEYGITLCPACGGSGINPNMKTLTGASNRWYGNFDLVGPCEIINEAGDTTFVENGDFVALINHDLSGTVYELVVFRVAGYRYAGTRGYCEKTECPFCHGEGGTFTYTIEGDNELPVLTNTMAPGKLVITKKVEGPNPDPDTFYEVKVTLTGSSIPKSVTFISSDNTTLNSNPITVDDDGTFTLYIKQDETITMNDITPDTAYTAEEIPLNGWTLLECSGETGTVSKTESSTAVFFNCFGSGKGDLSITKKISGATEAASQQEFTFEITLLDPKYAPVSGTFNVTGSGNDSVTFEKNGKAVITMKAGTLTIKDLPAGTAYTVKETGELPGWSLQSSADPEGKILSDETASVVFSNQYKAKGTFSLSIRKLLEGRIPDEGEFSFTLWSVNEDGSNPFAKETAYNQAGGTDGVAYVDFTDWPLSTEETLWFDITESTPMKPDPSVIYSTEKIRVEVPVTDREGKGNLSVGKYNKSGEWIPGPIYTMIPSGEEGNLITNRVKPGQLRLAKAVDGSLTPVSTDAMFDMLVTFTDPSGERWTGTDNVIRDDNGQEYTAEDGVFTVPVPADGQITLVDIPNGTAYKVEEDATAAAYGWTTDVNVYTGTVESLPDGEEPETVTLTNTYEPTGELELPVFTKRLTGAVLEKDQFSFCLADETGKVLQNVQNDGNGAVTFENLKYTLDDAGKTYTYLIYEEELNDKRYTADSEVRKIDVTVEEDPSAGPGGLRVTAGAVYNADSAPDPLVFTNTAMDSVNIPISKVWTGDTGHEDERGAITLTLYAIDKNGRKVQPAADTTVTANDRAANPWVISLNDAVNNDTLSGCWYNIPLYDESGEAYAGYTVEESGCPASYISFVSGNENDGFTAGNRLVFGSLPLSLTKMVDGETPEADNMFVFELLDSSGTTVRSVKNTGDTAVFEDLFFTREDAGTHVYTVREAEPEVIGYETDDTEYTLTVTVTDNGNGTLKIEKKLTADGNAVDAITFENKYAPTGSIIFTGKKTLTGRTMTADDKFTFTVREDGNPVATGANNGTEIITFTEIAYGLADIGSHTYTITEDSTTINGVTGDISELTVVVSVTDNRDGTLKTEIVDAESDEIEFRNTYSTEGGIIFKGNKILSGRAMTAEDLFTFTVKENGNPVATGANNGTEEITFTKIRYTPADLGIHTYTVTEDNTTAGGITRDDRELTVTVSVTDNGDGTMKAEIVDSESDDIQFTNTYTAEGSITLEGTKALTGRAMTADDRFTFTVKENGNPVAAGENNGTESITFDRINYTAADLGLHTYTITEDDTTAGGVTKDDSELTVVVSVTDHGDGTLKAEIVKAESDEPAFENIYQAAGGITLTGTKTLTGRAMTADDRFTFTVTENGNTVSTGANDITGDVTFTEIRYTQADAGIHTYTVTEDDTNLPGVSKDEHIFTVTVTVTDNGDGTLKTEVTGADGLNFVNPYEATGSFEPEAILYINENGQVPAPEEVFEFFITDDEGNVITRQNGKDGAVDFDEILYTLDDVGTHRYEIREKQLVNGNYITDPVRYIVETTVSDNGDGTLGVTRTVTRIDPDGSETPMDPDETPVFLNTTKVSITVHKEWQYGEEDDIVLTLYADGEKVNETTPVTDPETGSKINRINYVLTRNGYDYTFSQLIPENESGSDIVYTVKEKGIRGYMQIYSNTGAHADKTGTLYDGGTVINRAVTSIRIRKVWSGVPEEKQPKITLTLYRNGTKYGRKPSGPDANGWYTFRNLPLDGEYYVIEEPLEGLTTAYENAVPHADVTDRAYDGGTITNTGVPPTGDSANPMIWILTGLLAVCTGAGLMITIRKRKQN